MKENKSNDVRKEWRDRLRFFIDMVFVSAMTILIIGFKIPEQLETANENEFLKVLINQGSSLAVFVITFLVISVYWVRNLEYFSMISKVNIPFIWMHLAYLISIMLLPVANLLFVLYPEGIGPRVLFSILMIISGLISYVGMFYAHRNNLLREDINVEEGGKFTKQLLSEPIIATLALVVSFINPYFWDITFVLIPIILVLAKKYKYRIIKS